MVAVVVGVAVGVVVVVGVGVAVVVEVAVVVAVVVAVGVAVVVAVGVVMTCITAILTLWLALPHCWLDQHETQAQRRELYRSVAAAICAATKGVNGRAFLLRQSYEETKLCRYVLENRCLEGPPGQRCDEGHATGPWQLWIWCRDTWHGTQQDRLLAGAQCALGLASGGFKRCGTWEGAFAAQRGTGRCKAPWAATRAKLHARDAWRLKRLMEK